MGAIVVTGKEASASRMSVRSCGIQSIVVAEWAYLYCIPNVILTWSYLSLIHIL